MKRYVPSEKRTPPKGAPKATETPAAAAAERISRCRAEEKATSVKRTNSEIDFDSPPFPLRETKGFMISSPTQQATCTSGPSFPKLNPEATANGRQRDLMRSVAGDRKPSITNPPKSVLISGIPV